VAVIDAAAALARDGHVIVPDVVGAAAMDAIDAALAGTPSDGAGSRRLLDAPWCRNLALSLVCHPALASLLADAPEPVQCTLFDKSDARNWLVAMHQDLAVPARERVAHLALGAWSRKEGTDFVIAPAGLLDRMVGVRVHLDDCGAGNGPLRVVPGSHRHGRLDAAGSERLRSARGAVDCLVERGGVLVIRPLVLHASSRAVAAGRRRVLHFLFGPVVPGYGLSWPDGDGPRAALAHALAPAEGRAP
jgi:hypothetical protein